jgi:molybdopterin synthase catalytic subunit
MTGGMHSHEEGRGTGAPRFGDDPGGDVTGDADVVFLTRDPLPVAEMTDWATVPRAGAVVVFVGVVRDHAEGRDDVRALTYEAYEGPAEVAMRDVAAAARRRVPDVARIAISHRLGRLALREASVAVVVSAPHRADAFEAARYCIDTLKASVPIWKHEHWAGGDDWGVDATPIRAVEAEA